MCHNSAMNSFVFVEFKFSWFSVVLSNHEIYGPLKVDVTREGMNVSIRTFAC